MFRMISRLGCLGLLMLAACTMEHHDSGEVEARYQAPLTAHDWSITTSAKGTCVMSAGPNALELAHTANGSWVRSTRMLEPGNVTSLRIGTRQYHTSGGVFTQKESAAMVEDFRTGTKAYLEWSSLRIGTRARIVTTEIINRTFAEQYATCLKQAGLTEAAR